MYQLPTRLNIVLLFICNVQLLLFFPIESSRALRRKGELVDSTNKDWKGLWFPYEPTSDENKVAEEKHTLPMDQEQPCDDGATGIGIDFDPEDKRHSYNYLCMAGIKNWKQFMPNMSTEALLSEQTSVSGVIDATTDKCLNETISYSTRPPTRGFFRPMAPKFGRYLYLPPQRWLRALAEGAIVMLYHPCAAANQVTELENKLRGCLYHHIVTPSLDLQPERPLALVAWGKFLQISVVDHTIVVNFIKENAKHGPLAFGNIASTRYYEKGLLAEAHLVTDENDSEICGFSEM